MNDDGHAVWAEGLEKRYGEIEAVRAGTVHGLLGPNGAGKTTAVRVLSTLIRADGGRAAVAGLSEDTFGPDFDHFEFGLQRILDGLEVFVARRTAAEKEDRAATGRTAGDEG